MLRPTHATSVLAFLAGVLALLAASGCQKAPKLVPLPEPRQLTMGARYDGQPHVSPDGRLIAYSAYGASSRDLFVMDAAGRNEPRLLHAGPGDDGHPRWSPDGKTMAFSSDQDGNSDIWTIPAEGGEPKRLTVESGRDEEPDWSPSGDRIVFVSGRSGRPELWVLTLSTGAAELITAAGAPAVDHAVSSPAWDRDRIVFAAVVGGVSDLFAVDPKGGPWTRLTSGPARERFPVVSKDGRIAFESDSTSFFNISILEPDGRITPVTESRTDYFEMAWTPDGRSLVYTRRDAWALLALPAAGGAADTVLDPRGGNFHPTWSPDGHELAYCSNLLGQEDIWRVTVDEVGAGPITTNREADSEPDWSPAANRICYTAVHQGNSDIWIMDPSGIELQNLTQNPASDRSPRWTPDGKEIVFVSDRLGNEDIWVMSAAGGEARRLTDDPAPDRSPTVLPGPPAWLVFESLRDGTRALWKVPFGGGPVERLTRPESPGDWDGHPAAAREPGGDVLFTRSRGDNQDIYRVGIGGDRLAPVAASPTEEEDNGAWSPDGKRVACQSGGNLDVWMVQAPGPAAVPAGPKQK